MTDFVNGSTLSSVKLYGVGGVLFLLYTIAITVIVIWILQSFDFAKYSSLKSLLIHRRGLKEARKTLNADDIDAQQSANSKFNMKTSLLNQDSAKSSTSSKSSNTADENTNLYTSTSGADAGTFLSYFC